MKTAFLLACGTVVPFGFLILGAVLIWRSRHRLRRWRAELVRGGTVWPTARQGAVTAPQAAWRHSRQPATLAAGEWRG